MSLLVVFIPPMDNLYDEEFVHLPEKLRQLSELKEKVSCKIAKF